ncbi:MAG TPA: hypothetical protein VHF47_11700 [Acidimicrobiales bacterium]|nr:hypothetical protein [Acidimicrobiales bacterium]
MERLVLAAVLVAAALAVAWVLRRRRPEPPTQPRRYRVPQQLDRADFDHADLPWLVVVFTSSTCESCAGALDKARVLGSADVAVIDVSYQARRDLHERYAIDAVPTTLVVDADGVVQASFVGTPSATDLWAAVADARGA